MFVLYAHSSIWIGASLVCGVALLLFLSPQK